MTVAKKINSLAACQKWANSCVFIPTRGNFCALVWPQFLHSIVAKTAIRRNLQGIVKNADIAHFLRRPQYFNSLFSEQGGVLGGVFGVMLGECWANTHPVTFPLYKGVSASWGECCTLLRDYGSPATRLRLAGNEITARRQRGYGSSATIIAHCPRKSSLAWTDRKFTSVEYVTIFFLKSEQEVLCFRLFCLSLHAD